jgi:hypothetical protein
VDDYFVGAAQPREAVVAPGPPPSEPSNARLSPRTRKAPPQPFSDRELAFVACCAAVGAGTVILWVAVGRPPTTLWRVAYPLSFAATCVFAVVSPASQRRHRFGVGMCGVFVTWAMVRIAAAIAALMLGTHHPGRAATNVLLGLLGAAFFGLMPLLGRRLWRANRTLTLDMAARVSPPPSGRQLRQVWLTLADGRRVPATVAYGRQLAKVPSGVDATQVVDVHDR